MFPLRLYFYSEFIYMYIYVSLCVWYILYWKRLDIWLDHFVLSLFFFRYLTPRTSAMRYHWICPAASHHQRRQIMRSPCKAVPLALWFQGRAMESFCERPFQCVCELDLGVCEYCHIYNNNVTCVGSVNLQIVSVLTCFVQKSGEEIKIWNIQIKDFLSKCPPLISFYI